MDLISLDNKLALFGGIVGVIAIAYMAWMAYWARQKQKDLVDLKITNARIEGLLIGGRRR